MRPLCTGWNFSWSTRLASAQGLLQLWVRVRERAPSLRRTRGAWHVAGTRGHPPVVHPEHGEAGADAVAALHADHAGDLAPAVRRHQPWHTHCHIFNDHRSFMNNPLIVKLRERLTQKYLGRSSILLCTVLLCTVLSYTVLYLRRRWRTAACPRTAQWTAWWGQSAPAWSAPRPCAGTRTARRPPTAAGGGYVFCISLVIYLWQMTSDISCHHIIWRRVLSRVELQV